MDTLTQRMLPERNDLNRAFWTGGAEGRLLIQRCAGCGRYAHPPVAACPACGGTLRPEAVSGNGTIFAFTINYQAFNPAVQPPYVVAIVVLDEQVDLRIPTNIVNCDPEALVIGQPVKVVFEENGDAGGKVYVPLFEPR